MSDEELEMIKRRKLIQLMKMAAAKRAEEEGRAKQSEAEKEKERFFTMVLTPEAKRRLENLRERKPKVAEKIESAVIYVFANKLVNRRLTEIDIMRMERKIEGVEPRIMIKRRGEEKPLDLTEALRKED
ncbi:MAG: DNA-binding protein [Candidatus Freyarchaeota archaeon]|nr:DNA-binding protein [Candidatus Freyrarchaeum guaymaensis]